MRSFTSTSRQLGKSVMKFFLGGMQFISGKMTLVLGSAGMKPLINGTFFKSGTTLVPGQNSSQLSCEWALRWYLLRAEIAFFVLFASLVVDLSNNFQLELQL